MPITDVTGDVRLFTPGRACTGPIAIVLHSYASGLEVLDLDMERCPRIRPAQSPGCHTSFHYGIDGCSIHQYIADSDTAWGFGVVQPTCPTPVCPPDECASCTGITQEQYNPNLDGDLPTLPVFTTGPDGTVNCNVLHIAVTGQSGFSAVDAYGQCCKWMEKSYACFVRSLCEIFRITELTPTASTLLVHCNELLCIDIDQLVIDINTCLNAPIPVPPPCQCQATSVTLAAVCDVLGAFDAGTVVGEGTVLIGADCLTHAAVLTNISGIDTATINITIAEPTADNFTIQADILAPATCGGLVDFNNTALSGFLGATSTGVPTWYQTDFMRSNVVTTTAGTFTQIALKNANTLLINSGAAVILTPPTDACGVNHVWVKNITNAQITIASSGGELIDGVATITLDGTNPGAFPFGNDGGEAVHLVFASGAWYVL